MRTERERVNEIEKYRENEKGQIGWIGVHAYEVRGSPKIYASIFAHNNYTQHIIVFVQPI